MPPPLCLSGSSCPPALYACLCFILSPPTSHFILCVSRLLSVIVLDCTLYLSFVWSSSYVVAADEGEGLRVSLGGVRAAGASVLSCVNRLFLLPLRGGRGRCSRKKTAGRVSYELPRLSGQNKCLPVVRHCSLRAALLLSLS